MPEIAPTKSIAAKVESKRDPAGSRGVSYFFFFAAKVLRNQRDATWVSLHEERVHQAASARACSNSTRRWMDRRDESRASRTGRDVPQDRENRDARISSPPPPTLLSPAPPKLHPPIFGSLITYRGLAVSCRAKCRGILIKIAYVCTFRKQDKHGHSWF